MEAKSSTMSRRKKVDRNVLIDPDHLRREMEITAMCLRAHSELDDMGVDFVWSPAGILFKQTRPGAVLAAEKEDTGPVGTFLRFYRSEGYYSKRPKVHEAIEARVQDRRNKRIKDTSRSKRNLSATLDAEAAFEKACNDALALRHRVEDGNTEIAHQLGEQAWPIRWQNGIPIPECRPTKKRRPVL
jgi:hypothetical protein